MNHSGQPRRRASAFTRRFTALIAIILIAVGAQPASAQLSNGQAYLKGNNVAIGLTNNAAFGATTAQYAVPAGFAAQRPVQPYYGLYSSRTGDFSTSKDGDFFTPGTPEEGWGLSIGSGSSFTSYNNNRNGPLTNISGSLSNFTSTSSFQSVEWHGSAGGIQVDKTYTVTTTGSGVKMDVTLTNTGASTQSVYYMRNVDPDNNQSVSGSYTTTNTVDQQGPVQYLVSATQSDGSYISLWSLNPNAKVSYGGSSLTQRNAQAAYEGTAGLTYSGSATADRPIQISFKFANINPGQSVSFTYYYLLVSPSFDTTPPTITSITSTSANGTYIVGDNVNLTVNLSEPVATGSSLTLTLDTGATVTLTCSSGPCSNLNGTYAPSAGQNTADLTVTSVSGTVTDTVGNANSSPIIPAGQNLGDNKNIVINTSPAAPVVSTPANGSLTNNNRPAISGTAVANSTVTVSIDGAVVGTTTADGAGNWTFTPSSALSDGSHSVKATATVSGSTSPDSNTNTFTVDTFPPPAPVVTTPANGSFTNNNKPAITGSAEANSIVTVSIDGSVVGTTTANGSGNWTFTPTTAFPDGAHSVKATSTDAAGNTSVFSNTNTFTVDTLPPAAPVVSTPANASVTNNDKPAMSGTAEPGSTVSIDVDGSVVGTTTADAAGNWTFTPSTALADGSHSVKATATDAPGNTSVFSNTNTFTVDTAPPGAPVVSTPANGSITNNNKPAITGSAEANSTVTVSIDGSVVGTTTANGAGNWTFTPTTSVTDGAHSVKATATDAAGNTSVFSNTNTFTVDTVAPAAPVVTTPANGSITNNDKPAMSGTAEPGSTVTIDVDGSVVGTTTADAAGNWTFTPSSALADGSHSVKATATDAAGNTSAFSNTNTFTIDATPPAAPVVFNPANGSFTNDNKPAITGSAEANSTVTVSIDGTVVGTTTADGAGNWMFTPTTALAEGPHNVKATATDAAGNTSLFSSTNTFTVDTVAPETPVVNFPEGPVVNAPAVLSGGGTPAVIDLPATTQTGDTLTLHLTTPSGTITLNHIVTSGEVSAGSATILIPSADLSPDGNYSATATITDLANNVGPSSSTANFAVDTTANLSVTITPSTLVPGSTVYVLVAVANAGPSDANAPKIILTLPASTSFNGPNPAGYICAQSGQTVTCDATSSLATGSSANFSLPVSLPASAAADAAAITSVAISSTTLDPSAANNTGSAATPVTPSADLAITVAPTTFAPGTTTNLQVTVINHGPSDAAAPVAVVNLPSGATWTGTNPSGYTCLASGSPQTVTCTARGPMAPNGPSGASFDLPVSVPSGQAADPAAVTSVSVSSPTSDPVTANNTPASVSTPVAPGNADLSILIGAPAAVLVPGTSTTIPVTITNAGPADAYNPVVTITLPVGVHFGGPNPAGYTCAQSGQSVTCTASGPMAPNGPSGASFNLPVSIDPGASADPSATVSGTVSSITSDPSRANNSLTGPTPVSAPSADLAVSVKPPTAPLTPGATSSIPVTVTNDGPSNAANPVVTITLPTGVSWTDTNPTGYTCAQSGQSVTCTADAPMGPNGPSGQEFLLPVNVAQNAPYDPNATITVSVSSATADPNPSSNTPITTLAPVGDPRADLAITIGDPSPVLIAGGTSLVPFTVMNAGPSDATAPVVTITLPVGVSFTGSNPAGFTCVQIGQSVTCTATDPLVVGANITLQLPVKIDKVLVSNPNAAITASVSSTTIDPQLSNNGPVSKITPIVKPVISLQKRALQPEVSIGGVLEYSLRVRDESTLDMVQVTVSDVLPQGLVYRDGSSTLDGAAITPTVSTLNGRQKLVWVLPGTLAAGAERLIRFATIGTPGLAGISKLENTAVVAAKTVTGNADVGSDTAATGTASVKVNQGVFSDHSVLVGRVFFDQDGNGRFDEATDRPAPGVKVYLSNGRYAITDANGRYSMNDLEPGSYALRLDPATVSNGLEATAEDLGQGDSRLLRVSGGIITANFALTPTGSSQPAKPTEAGLPAMGFGTASLQLNLNAQSGFSVEGRLQGFARGTLENGVTVTAAINQQASYAFSSQNFDASGTLLSPANPFDRFPLLGDASRQGSDAQSADGFYVRFDQGQNFLSYGQFTPGFSGLLSSYSPNYQGVQTQLHSGGFRSNLFLASVPNADRRVSLRGDGTSLYRLPAVDAPIEDSSERVLALTYDRNSPSLKLTETLLSRGRDYTIDYASGTIVLSKALLPEDANGNPQFLVVEYASKVAPVTQEWRFGVQGALGQYVGQDGYEFTGTALVFKAGEAPLFGVGGNFHLGGLSASFEATASGVPGLAAHVEYTATDVQAQLNYRELWPGYVDPNDATAVTGDRALQFAVAYQVLPSLSLTGRFGHNQDFLSGAANDRASFEARNDFGIFDAALGVYGNFNYAGGIAQQGDAWITAGVGLPIGPWRFGLLQRVPVTSGTPGDTTLSADYALGANFGLRLSDTLTYAANGLQQKLAFGVRGSFSNTDLLRVALGNADLVPELSGTTNASASYELDTVSGEAGLARLGLETTVPLSSTLSAQVAGDASLGASQNMASLSLGLRYSGETLKASTKAQYAFTPTGFKQVYNLSAIVQASESLSFSPSLEYANGPDGEGGKFSVAGAYRGESLTVLTNNIGRFGFYAPQATGNEIQGEIQANLAASQRFSLRLGTAYRVNGLGFIGELVGGATYFFSDTFGVGVNAAYLFQPSTGTSNVAFGLEASYRLVDGVLVSVGFNLAGFQGLGSFSTAPGFYLRFDVKLDEHSFGR